jgi:uncharacterized membrane protein YoaK (UPF0700 family)
LVDGVGRFEPLEYALALTSFAAGTVDVISFTKLGGILASAMTGNLAFLALYSAAGAIYSAIGSLISLSGFILGAAAGTLLTRDRLNHRAVTVLIGSETILLLGASVLWFAASHRNGYLSTDVLILILSSAMGLQSICGKKINLSSIPTVVFTSTLTNIVIAVTEALALRRSLTTDTKRQLVSFSLYFAGAFIAGLLAFFNLRIIIFLPLAAAVSALWIHTRGTLRPVR